MILRHQHVADSVERPGQSPNGKADFPCEGLIDRLFDYLWAGARVTARKEWQGRLDC